MRGSTSITNGDLSDGSVCSDDRVEVVVQNFIGGEFHGGIDFLDSYDPSTGKVWAKVPSSGEREVEEAVTAAKAAYPKWSKTPVQERSKLLCRIADILEARLEEFAEAESRDQGKPVTLARTVDIPRSIYNFRFFSTAILHHLGSSSILAEAGAMNYTTQSPVGLAGLISPWNLPLYLLTFKIAPALVTGNVVIVKPSEMTSVTAWMLCKVFQEAGLPAGVVNMVFGTGQEVGEPIAKHPEIPLISFTGSTPTAQRIRQAAAPFCKKLSLELGGKNAAIIFNDADLEKCIPTTIRSSFTNQGEVCLCTSRIYVQEEIYQPFLEKFVAAARNLKVGDPRDEKTNIGALVSKEHFLKVKSYVDLAEREATILCGGGKDNLNLPEHNQQGYFMPPTVISGVKECSRLMKEEIFGPVTCVVPFRTEEEVIELANDVRYGLCAALWTRNVEIAHRVAQELNVGTVWTNCWLVRDLNMPFGGMKDSGIGREGFVDSIDFYTEKKTICIKYT